MVMMERIRLIYILIYASLAVAFKKYFHQKCCPESPFTHNIEMFCELSSQHTTSSIC